MKRLRGQRGLGFIIFIIMVSSIAFWARHWYQKQVPPIPHKILVGTSADFPPFCFKKDSEIVGFDIDVAREVCARLNKPCVFVDMPFDVIFAQLESGAIHIAAAGATPTERRLRIVDFTDPYLMNDPVILLLPAQSKATTLVDLQERRVAVVQGYTADSSMTRVPGIIVVRYPSVDAALKDLKKGNVDAFAATLTTSAPIFSEHGAAAFKIITLTDSTENIALALSKKCPELAKRIKATINEMITDGTIKRLKEKWHIQ